MTGKYFFTASLRLDNKDSDADYYILWINGSNRDLKTILNPDGQDNNFNTISVNGLLDMDANDTAYINFMQSGGSAQTHQDGNANYSYFSGYLVA